MTRTTILACGIALSLRAPAFAADWQPGKAPLMTKWAADVKPDRVHPEYPRPQLVRTDWLSLNGLWQLAFAKEGEPAPLSRDLPERILVPFPVESALSGVMKRAERLWYRRTFQIPAKWTGQRVLLHFGAVDWEAHVWVNGKEVGTHQGGFDPFTIDITEALKIGGDQELIVGVWDPTDAGPQPRGKQVRNPQGIYYTPTTGIWQTVWLEPVPVGGIAGLKIVPDLDGSKVIVTVSSHGSTMGRSLRVRVKEGNEIVVAGQGDFGQPIAIPLKQAKVWSPESPHLYDLQILLVDNVRGPIDEVQSYFGMRKIAIAKDARGVTRLFLNSKAVFQVGPLDQGFWPDGLLTPPTDAALKYDIEITKQLGFNMTRKHVKVEPDRWYYWCDKLGLLVWQDMPSGERGVGPGKGEIKRSPESAAIYERELKAMIDALHNHPCIIMWVVFNEGWGQYDTVRITDWTKKYDPTRLVNGASGWNDMKCGDVHDIHVYPGPGALPIEPNRAGVLGEFGGLGLGVDGHTWAKKTWGYRGTASSEDLTRKYERLLRGVWQLKEEKGLSAAVYTQITDVETEANGLLTYDRAVIKVDGSRVAAVNRGEVGKIPLVRVVVPTLQGKGLPWRYTLEQPTGDWFKTDYDDKTWKQGPGGFGTKGTPGTSVRTEWKSPTIWLRREFTLPEGDIEQLHLLIHHDEDAEVYLNGVLAAKPTGYVTEYEEVPISPEARKTLKPGPNVLAVSCKQTGGGQYIDVGLAEIK